MNADTLKFTSILKGFTDQSHFTREFKHDTRMTPGDYRKRFAH